MITNFITRYPRLIVGGLLTVAVAVHLGHYAYLKSRVDTLSNNNAELEKQLAVSEKTLAAERKAAAEARAARNEARRALDTFRQGRDDVASIEWAAELVPEAERARMCLALPELKGCEKVLLPQ